MIIGLAPSNPSDYQHNDNDKQPQAASFCVIKYMTLLDAEPSALIRNIFSKISLDIRHIFNGFLRSGFMLELELIGVSSSQLSESLYRGVQRHKSLLRLGVANPVQVWLSESSNLVPGLTGCLWILK
jgi:hypothetical protein